MSWRSYSLPPLTVPPTASARGIPPWNEQVGGALGGNEGRRHPGEAQEVHVVEHVDPGGRGGDQRRRNQERVREVGKGADGSGEGEFGAVSVSLLSIGWEALHQQV